MKPFSARIADVLAESVRGTGEGDDPRPRLADIVALLGKRSFGVALVLFGLPNLLPVPGLPLLCGVIIGVVAFQMVLGKESLVLPAWLGERRVNRADLQKILLKAEPTLRWFERVMRPRLHVLTMPTAQRLLGVVLLTLALALMAPIPFFGGIPPGIAVMLFGLAIAERDGAFVIAGAIAGVIALVFTAALTYAILRQIVVFVLSSTGMV
jgi:hypothetical protein